ncbi:MAG: hypothetical protein CNLJKLNK_00503 [Holosporales bacterium]
MVYLYLSKGEKSVNTTKQKNATKNSRNSSQSFSFLFNQNKTDYNIKKNIKRNCLIGAFFFALGSNPLLASAQGLMKFGMQTALRPHQMVSVPYGVSRLYNGLATVQRNYSHSGENNQTEFPDLYLSKKKGHIDQFARCELLFKQCQRLFQEINSWNIQSERSSHSSMHEPANVIALQNAPMSSFENVDNDSLTKPISHQPAQKKEPKSPILKNTQPLQELKTFDYHSSKIIKMKQDALIHKALSMAKTSKEINVKELRCIIDVYTALVRRPKDGITKVLTGITDTPKSHIFLEMSALTESKGLTLDAYRKIYTKLSNDFKENVAHVIYRAAESILKENDHLNDTICEIKNVQDASDLIAKGSHPLYPVDPEEVSAIFDLYSALDYRPKDGITKVLNYFTNTNKSSIYNEIVHYAEQRGSNLEAYRHMYAKVGKALNEKGIKIIYGLINERKMTSQAPVSNSSLQNEDAQEPQESVSYPPQEEDVSDFKPLVENNDQDDVSCEYVQESPTESTIVHQENTIPDQTDEQKNTKFSMSIQERDRLNRLYGLLPEYSGRSVTGVLSGSTLDNNLPIWNAVQEAIEQIKKESIKDDDASKINLEYFRKLFFMSLHSAKTSTKMVDLSGDVLRTADGKYSITKQEQERLNRIYNLLSDFSSRSITGVLSGSTIDNGLPVWKAVQKAIERIKQEAIRKGDKTTLDFNYFRKLHWSSVRVIGRGGNRDLEKSHKEKIMEKPLKSKIKLKAKIKKNNAKNRNKR